MLSQANFLKALEIIQGGHSAKITINYVKSGDVVTNAVPLVIHECNASTVNRLVEAGFSLFPTSYGISVSHFKG